MSEDFQIQQGVQPQTSTAPYFLTGAAIGAAGGGAAAHYFTKPKYGDIKDIVAETNDKDKFDKKIEAAAEEDKKFLEDVKEYAKKEEAFGAEYDKKLEEFKAAQKTGKEETEAYKKDFVEPENAAKKALEEKKAALLAEEKEEVVQSKKIKTPKKDPAKSARAQKALNEVKKQIAEEQARIAEEAQKIQANFKEKVQKIKSDLNYDAVNLYKAEESVSRLEEEMKQAMTDPTRKGEIDAYQKNIENAKNAVTKYKANLEENINRYVEEMNFSGTEDEVKAAKAAKIKEIKTYFQDVAQEQVYNNRTVNIDVKEIAKKQSKAYDKILELTGKSFVKLDKSEFDRQINRQLKANENGLEALKNIQKTYNEIVETSKSTGSSISVKHHFEGKLGKGKFSLPLTGTTSTTTTTETAPVDAIAETRKRLNAKENKLLDEILAGGKSEEEIKKALDEAISARTNNINSIKAKITGLNSAIAEVKAAKAQITQLGGEGAHIHNGKIVNADGKVVELKPQTYSFARDIEIPNNISVPETSQKLEELQKKLTSIEAQLEETTSTVSKVKKYTAEQVEEMLAKDKEELAKLTAAREKAYAELKDVAAKSEDEINKAFHETLGEGITDKASYQKEKAKKELESLTEKYAEKVKRRFGFAEHANWKIGAVAAGAAVVLGGLFSLLAPKDQA